MTGGFLIGLDGNIYCPVIVGRSKSPRGFRSSQEVSRFIGGFYKSSSSAWMTGDIFAEYILKVNRFFRICQKKVILLVDNCSAHQLQEDISKQLTHVKIHFIPKNTTSILQPADAGVIAAFKRHYQFLVSLAVLSLAEEHHNNVTSAGREPTGLKSSDIRKAFPMKRCLQFFRQAFSMLSPISVRNCWRHCGLSIANVIEPQADSGLVQEEVMRQNSFVEEVVNVLHDGEMSDEDHEAEEELSIQAVVDDVIQEHVNQGKLYVEGRDENSDGEEEENIALPAVSSQEAEECIDKLMSYFLGTRQEYPDIFSSLFDIKAKLPYIVMRELKQSLVTDFFLQ